PKPTRVARATEGKTPPSAPTGVAHHRESPDGGESASLRKQHRCLLGPIPERANRLDEARCSENYGAKSGPPTQPGKAQGWGRKKPRGGRGQASGETRPARMA